MPPQSRGSYSSSKSGSTPQVLHSKSTPNLPTLQSLRKRDSQTNTPDAPPPHQHVSSKNTPSDPYNTTTTARTVTAPANRGAFLSVPPTTLDGAHAAADHDDDDDDDLTPHADENPRSTSVPKRPLYNLNSRSHTYLGPSVFAPPFYNRPPTPLPPSPSLTSLLRPSFTANSSRPTTPDPSSDEGLSSAAAALRSAADGSQTPNSAAVSATLNTTFRNSKPIPRASPKVPTYEYYGFTLYLTSSLAFIVYVFWAFLPSPFLHQLGIYYYPNRWWALAIPAWTVMLIVYIYVALAAYNTCYLTLPLDSVEALVDEAASVAVVDAQGNIIRNERPSWGALEPTDGKRKSARSNGHLPGGRARSQGGGGGGNKNKKSHQQYPYQQTLPQSRHAASTPKSHPPGPDLDWRTLWNEGTDAVMDIPIGGVCEILYGDASPSDAELDSDYDEGGV